MNNLPIPQSRSEELMNAFIQRDSSQISTPQSRIEEFWYHLIEGTNSLPIPQSRNELLLKKIIENDTHQIPLAQSRTEEFLVSILTGDINKLPIPQSRSEYYLDYIARNNLLLNDIDYVRYSGTNITATNTVQKPFRSAILSGQTLVNLFNFNNEKNLGNCKLEFLDNQVVITEGMHASIYIPLKKSTTYTLFAKSRTNGRIIFIQDYTNHNSRWVGTYTNANELTIYKFKTFDVDSNYGIMFYSLNGEGIYEDVMVLEGDYTNVDIPYFEGMQSVKMPVLKTTGKNLFSFDNVDTEVPLVTKKDSSSIELNGNGRFDAFVFTLNLEPNTTYTLGYTFHREIGDLSLSGNRTCQIEGATSTNIRIFYTSNENNTPKSVQFTTGATGQVTIQLYGSNDAQTYKTSFNNVYINKSNSVGYEPYKSNILTVNEEVELRGVGEIKDELNLLTGEVTQRVGYTEHLLQDLFNFSTGFNRGITYRESDDRWLGSHAGINHLYFKSILPLNFSSSNNPNSNVSIYKTGSDWFVLSVKSSELISKGYEATADGLLNYAKNEKMICAYKLLNEVIKTVDLKVVNQDGNQVKELSAFDGTTYIVSGSASDNSLIAITEVEVPTKLIEVLDGVKSLSSDVEILINEVDNTQKLQDENSTMAMSAMTELYEMILMMGGND